jgi:antitoxin ParD1/3/4
MAGRASNPVTVTLGELDARARARVESGHYTSMSEVLRAGLRALEREEAALDDLIRARIAEVNADPDDFLSLPAAMDELRAGLTRRG